MATKSKKDCVGQRGGQLIPSSFRDLLLSIFFGISPQIWIMKKHTNCLNETNVSLSNGEGSCM